MKKLLAPIDQAGRVVIPKEIREELAIKAGDLFAVSVHGADVTLTPAPGTSGFVRKGKALVFAAEGGATISEQTINELLDGLRSDSVKATENLLRAHKRGR